MDRKRTIAAEEIQTWFGKTSKLRPSDFETLAAKFTRMRWPGDPPLPEHAPCLPAELDEEADRWWDFKGSSRGAQCLLKSLPKMKRHWEDLQWAPETAHGYEAICRLETALQDAMQYVHHPFGPPVGPSMNFKKPKKWHVPSVTIASMIRETLQEASVPLTGLSTNTVTVKVVHCALSRMGYRGTHLGSRDTVAAHDAQRGDS